MRMHGSLYLSRPATGRPLERFEVFLSDKESAFGSAAGDHDRKQPGRGPLLNGAERAFQAAGHVLEREKPDAG